jgi:hypothetical protein
MFVVHETLPPKNEKMMQYPSIKFPLLSHFFFFFFKKKIFFHFFLKNKKKKKKKKKNTFLNEISSKNLKSLHGPRF